MTDRSAGDAQGPLGLAVGLTLVVLFAVMPALLVPAFYLYANVVALIAGRDLGAATVNVPALLIGVVGIVTVLTLVAAIAANAIGRGLSPKRRRA